ncbi:hypothetical protein ACYSNR_01025 [Enterococcus sp. LJL128]
MNKPKELEQQILVDQFERQFGFSPFRGNTTLLSEEAKEILSRHEIEYINERYEQKEFEGGIELIHSIDGVVFKEIIK